MGLTLTQREAETLRGCIKKINVIKNKKDRYIGEEYKLNNVVIALKKIIVDAGREYVLTDKEY
jgi:hypothetical protein